LSLNRDMCVELCVYLLVTCVFKNRL